MTAPWDTIALLLAIMAAAFVLNLPFGYLRMKTRKFSIQWFLCIHLPIPAIIVFRLLAGFGYSAVPFFLAASVAGQVAGGRLRKKNETVEV